MVSSMAAFIFVVGLSGIVSLWLFNVYGSGTRDTAPPANRSWMERWEFTPLDLGGFTYAKLALISVCGLYLELLMIRWVSSEIRIFAYFKNFVLIACFLGFGLGCYLVRRRTSLLSLLVPLATLALIVKLPWPALRQLIVNLPSYIGATSEVNVWGVPYIPMSLHSLGLLADATIVVVPMFALVSFAFIPIGQQVGWYLENAPNGIYGYTVNILGSLVGICLYTLLCFLFQPPAVWFLLGGIMLVWFLWPVARLRWASAAVLIFCVGLTALGPGGGAKDYWSPYQKLTLTPVHKDGELVNYQLTTNGSWYQQILNLSPSFVNSHPKYFEESPVTWNAYNLPYHFFQTPPQSVLVLGAGTGNDAAAALRNGVGQATAVEIDPLILQLGKTLHFERPYDSPRVKTVLDDARSYMETTDQRFDMVVFCLLDSHTTSSYYSNIRIDNYVYTLEAMEAAKRLLKPDGIMVIKFQVNTPWIAGRLVNLLQTAFGRPPLEMETDATAFTTSGPFFVAGSQARIERALADPSLANYVQTHQVPPVEKASLTSDDWPYFYQHEPGLPGSVIILSVVLILLCWSFMRQTGAVASSIRWHFFFLGAGFLLLEAQIISKMALLFGTTWMVNSIVIAGLLSLIVASNFVVQWKPKIPVNVGYVGILCTILIGYVMPLERLFFRSIWLKALAATAVLCLPVFFAGIVFIRSFAQEGFRSEALGSNLLGALTGGLLESLSMWTGIRSLLLVAAVLYVASWWALGAQNPLEKLVPEAGDLASGSIGLGSRRPHPTA
jgi:SAM-dependent methyltransferase